MSLTPVYMIQQWYQKFLAKQAELKYNPSVRWKSPIHNAAVMELTYNHFQLLDVSGYEA